MEAALIISIAGAIIAGLTTALCAVLAFMGKFAIATLDKRIDDAKSRLNRAEDLVSAHANQLASAKTQTDAEEKRFTEIGEALKEVRSKLNDLTDVIGELNVQVRRNASPPPFARPYPNK